MKKLLQLFIATVAIGAGSFAYAMEEGPTTPPTATATTITPSPTATPNAGEDFILGDEDFILGDEDKLTTASQDEMVKEIKSIAVQACESFLYGCSKRDCVMPDGSEPCDEPEHTIITEIAHDVARRARDLGVKFDVCFLEKGDAAGACPDLNCTKPDHSKDAVDRKAMQGKITALESQVQTAHEELAKKLTITGVLGINLASILLLTGLHQAYQWYCADEEISEGDPLDDETEVYESESTTK